MTDHLMIRADLLSVHTCFAHHLGLAVLSFTALVLREIVFGRSVEIACLESLEQSSGISACVRSLA